MEPDEGSARTAEVKGATAGTVSRYLPGNYHVTATRDDGTVIITGHDLYGWTLDGYVIPRLQSGLITCREVTS